MTDIYGPEMVLIEGGEKISPIEIDSALLSHPAVAEAVYIWAEAECYSIKHCHNSTVTTETMNKLKFTQLLSGVFWGPR